MPTYDFKCSECGVVSEKIKPSTCTVIPCPECLLDADLEPRLHVGMAYRLLSAPAGIRMGDGRAQRKAQRIQEPVWRYPDGHIESLNSANTRPEE